MSDAILAPSEHALLLQLQCRALDYFLENQTADGWVLDRQANHGPRQAHGLCSMTATGMGWIALALASAPPYRLLTRTVAIERIGRGVRSVLDHLPHKHGVVPHFVHSATREVHGHDVFSTIETAWLAAGSLWAASFLEDLELAALANQFYERIDWQYWSAPRPDDPRPLLRHGQARDGRLLACCWDRLNGETIFMYVLAAGAAQGRSAPPSCAGALQPFYATVAGLRFHSADLGLFVFQYGLDLLDLQRWQMPGGIDLWAEAGLATQANRRHCQEAAADFATYLRFWGLSAGDGPGDPPHADTYRCYAPARPLDGTAHLMAAAAAIAHDRPGVLHNLLEALHDQELAPYGRYGYSNVNLDRRWVGKDMVGIDAGALVLALDNELMENRVRRSFHSLPCVQRGLERLGFCQRGEEAGEGELRQAS
jgi:hypothetical protein